MKKKLTLEEKRHKVREACKLLGCSVLALFDFAYRATHKDEHDPELIKKHVASFRTATGHPTRYVMHFVTRKLAEAAKKKPALVRPAHRIRAKQRNPRMRSVSATAGVVSFAGR